MTASDLIQQATWRGDDHIDTSAQRLVLRAIAHTTIDGGHSHGQATAQLRGMLCHLQGQFARGHDHQHPRPAGARR